MGASESKSDDREGRRSRRQNGSPYNNVQSLEIPQEYLSEHVSALLESQRDAYDARIREIERNVARAAVLNAQTISNVCTNNSMQTQATAPSPGRIYPQINPESRPLSPAFEARSTSNTSAFHGNTGRPGFDANRNYGSPNYPGSPSNTIIPSPSAPTLPSASGQGVQSRNRSRTRNDRNGNNGSVCPTCKNKYGLSRLFQCGLGHSSCENCKQRQRACGICHHPITDMRNITLEVALAETTEPCPNSGEGCTLHLKLADMPIHEKECPFKEMYCPFYNLNGLCNWKGKLSQLKYHFSEAHSRSCAADVDKEMTIINMKTPQPRHHLYLVELGTYCFLVHYKINRDAKMFYMAIQLIGTKMSSDKWTYNIQIYNKNEPRRKLDYTDICKSNSEDVKDIFKDCNCLSMPLDYALSFVNEDIINYKFYIKKNVENQRNNPNFRGRGGARGRGKRPS